MKIIRGKFEVVYDEVFFKLNLGEEKDEEIHNQLALFIPFI